MHNIQHMAGRHYNECRTLIQSLDWDGWYPVVDSDGILTGGVADARHDLDIVDIADDGSVVIRTDGRDAMLARKMWIRYDFYDR